jgi:hypothetical protein
VTASEEEVGERLEVIEYEIVLPETENVPLYSEYDVVPPLTEVLRTSTVPSEPKVVMEP